MLRFSGKQHGFTLIEVIMAQIVLVIAALATCSAFVVGSRFNAESEAKTIAANIAQLKMEDIKSTHYRSIVYEHPAGVALFESEPQGAPYWTVKSNREWIISLPEGQYEISYPGLDLVAGVIPDPLVVKVTISWASNAQASSSLSLETIFARTPGDRQIRRHENSAGRWHGKAAMGITTFEEVILKTLDD